MKSKLIPLLLILLLSLTSATARPKVLKRYRSWPMGLSVSVLTPPSKLEQVKAAGFEWVEVTLNSQRKTDDKERRTVIRQFRDQAERIGLNIWSVHLPFGREWDISATDEAVRKRCVEQIAWFIDAVKELAPKKLILHPSSEPIADVDRPARIEASVRSIDELCTAARKIGAQLLIEDLPRTCLGNTSQEMHAILQRADKRVGVCFDTNHLLKQTPQAFAASLGKRIESLHVSDYDAVDERHWVMGRGVIDWPALITAIAQAGYDGVFMFEVGGYDSFTQIADTWRAVESQLATKK